MAILILRDEEGSERHIEIDSFPFRMGKKATSNDLVLNRPNVSREHCLIDENNGAFVLRDANSRNGTFLDRKYVEGEVPLPDGGVIRVGPFTLKFFAFPPGEIASTRRTPVALKKKIHAHILATLDLKHTDLSQKSPEELREKTSAAARVAVRQHEDERPAWLSAEALVTEVVHEAIGLGPIEELLADDTVDEIMVNAWDKVYVERAGKIELSNKQFTSNDQILAVIRRILAPIGRRIDESSPMVDARLPDGSRVNAIIPPLALTGSTVTIRKFARIPYTDQDLIRFGTISQSIADFLRIAVVHRTNICISGGTGSGKTTLLNILST